MLRLVAELASINVRQTELARYLGVSSATVSLAINYDKWPKDGSRCGGERELKDRIHDFLLERGVAVANAARAFDEKNEAPQQSHELGGNATAVAAAVGVSAANHGPDESTAGNPTKRKDLNMLLRKHTISPEAREYFDFARDPFTNEMRSVEDVFLNGNIKKIRAAVRNTAQFGGMLALIAESGAGKSTIRKDLAHWIKSSDQPVIVIEPYVYGMSDSDRTGRLLRAEDIEQSIIRKVSPGTRVLRTAQARKAQLHDLLRASAETGNRHVLIIEEAHLLAVQTINSLKGFYELEDGFTSLLAIILIGQTELDWKLGDNAFGVRQIVQRMEKRYLEPLDNDIEAYLRHKFSRIGEEYEAVFDADVPDAILNRLRVAHEIRIKGNRTIGPRSLCHPLAINNLVGGAINLAALSGEDKVTGALIVQVGRDGE